MCMINHKGRLRCLDVDLGTPKTVIPKGFDKNVKLLATGMNSSTAITKNGVLKFWYNEPQFREENVLTIFGYSKGSVSHGK